MPTGATFSEGTTEDSRRRRPPEKRPAGAGLDVGFLNGENHSESFMKEISLTLFICLISLQASLAEPLYTQQGVDPPFAAVLKSRKLGSSSNSKNGVTGSTVNVKNTLVELTPESRRPISNQIKIHTLGNSAVPRDDFGKWSRWYQEKGHTQVFRLFKGETNVHNSRANAARIEAFSNVKWGRGSWHEWSGTYTLIKPIGAMIFQVKNEKNDWAVSLAANSSGTVKLNHRRGNADVVIAKDMIGKPFHIRVRDNGHDYEVYLDGKKVGAGVYERPEGATNFRWGMYVGKNEVTEDAMIFVSGATVDGKAGK